ncbi:MAG: HAD-IA family hydrolase [Gammaproteobacteria bacterium]|nr:HAD-IA family hydrolase [Gammaproteobacteria bacterium]
MQKTTTLKGVLFDLDGTLLDTAPGFSAAINRFLRIRNLPQFSTHEIRSNVGRGIKGFLKETLNIDEHHQDYRPHSAELFNYYHEHMFDDIQLFSGMDEILDYLSEHHIPWGIVTNKPSRFTDELIKHLPALQKAQCVISADTLNNCKPHPEPILHACKLMNVEPQDCIYVGDAEIDIIASKAAGMPVIAALYGYIHTSEDPLIWLADGYINHPSELLSILKR